MKGVRLRFFARVNPPTPEFDALGDADEVPFLPLEAVWPGTKLDVSRRRPKAEVSTGYTRFREGDVLVPKITPTFEADRTVLALGLEGGVAAGTTELHIVRTHPEVDPRFVRYVLRARPFLLGGEAAMIGVAGQKRVPEDWLKDYRLDVTDQRRQRAIADYLDAETARIDALIAKKRRMIELLEERFAELVATAVTQGLHPGEGLAKGPDWVARAPATWEMWPLGRLVRMVSGGTPNKDTERFWNGEMPWASPKDMKRFRLADTEDHVSDEAVAVAGLKMVPAGTVLVVVRGMILAHSFPVAITTEPMTINQDMKALLPTPRVRPEFLAYLLVGLKSVMLSFVEEAAHGTRKLATEVWSKLPVAIPGHAEQRAIEQELERESTHVAKATSRLEHQIGLLTERRQALITAAVTGELTVPGAVA